MLRGAPVFQGKSVVEVCSHHLHTAPEPLSARLGDSLPPELERIVLACLEKHARARPQSAAELSSRLERCLDGLHACQAVQHLHVLRAQRMLERLDAHLSERVPACPIAA